MLPLGVKKRLKLYLLKRYRPSDRFWTFFSESVRFEQIVQKYTNNVRFLPEYEQDCFSVPNLGFMHNQQVNKQPLALAVLSPFPRGQIMY